MAPAMGLHHRHQKPSHWAFHVLFAVGPDGLWARQTGSCCPAERLGKPGFPQENVHGMWKTTGFPHLFVCYHQGNYSGLFWIGTSFFWMGYHKSVFFRWFSLHLQYLLWWWSTALSVICRPVFSQGHPTKHWKKSMNWGMTRFSTEPQWIAMR